MARKLTKNDKLPNKYIQNTLKHSLHAEFNSEHNPKDKGKKVTLVLIDKINHFN